MNSMRWTAVVAGVFFVVAAVAAVVGLWLYQPLLDDPGYVLGAGDDGRVLLGALCEVLLVVSVVGTAVTLYPVLERQGRAVALGYVAGRVMEAAVITVGIVAVLSVVTLRQGAADDGARVAVAEALVAAHDWTFRLGPGLFIGINSLLLAWLVHRARLVHPVILLLGLVGGPLVFVSTVVGMTGLYDQISTVGGLAAVPVAAWEMSLAVYLIVWGFRPSSPLLEGRRSPVPAVV